MNQELLATYWRIGEIIVKYEQNDQIRAAYGEKTLKYLSKELTKAIGKGFSLSNIYNMRQFYMTYPIFQTVSGNCRGRIIVNCFQYQMMIKEVFMRRNVSTQAGR